MMKMKRGMRVLALGLTLVMLLTGTGLAEILRPGASGDAVVRLQQALTILGYYNADIDGDYGDVTKRAVSQFQEAFGLTVDGKAGSATQYQIKLLTGIEVTDIAVPGESTGVTGGDNQPDQDEDIVIQTGLFSGDYKKLVFGASGTRVRILQKALQDLGFTISKIDGVYGTSTYKAVKEFQDLVGLTVDGKAGPQTLKELERYFDAAGNLLNGPLIVPGTEGGDEDLAYDVPKRTLRPGASGLDVMYTQDRLKELKYYKGTTDGQYGSGTTAAVKAFQENNGLTVDGSVGPLTRSVLFSDDALAADESPVIVPGDRILRPGMEGDDVKAVQQRLANLGYYTGKQDGQYGTGTVAAVKAFQTRNGIEADGVCGAETIRVLYSSTAIDAGSSVTTPPAAIPTGKPTRILRPGYTGEDVKSVQNQLKQLNYYTGVIDGVYGTGTVAAVKAFQARNSLTVDGKVGAKTADCLYSESAIPADTAVTPTPDPVETPDRTLRIGMTGEDVKLLQTRLIELGYLKGTADGVFGSGTLEALKDFQMRNGLSADGAAGTKTYKKLFSDSAIPSASGTETTPPVTSAIPTRVLYEGCTGDDVKQVQTRLKALGYLTGSVDGKYGAITTAAMKAFQLKNGLTDTGMGDTDTYRILFSDTAVSAGATTGSTVTYTTLRLGASGNAVIRLQTMLSSLKYTVNINGYYDETTKAAVLAFQLRNNLEADGIAGSLTQTKLYSGDCVTGDTDLPTYDNVIGGNGGGPSSTRQVQLLHWQNDLKGTLVKNGNTLLVYEPESNSSYYVRVYACGRHCDAEPITKQDVAIMKAAWGGKFAWTEKPVYVRLTNGTWCIASTHSMPHEENFIANNDFEGHLCIHFPRTMSEAELNDPENGVRHQNDIRKHWKKITGETILW